MAIKNSIIVTFSRTYEVSLDMLEKAYPNLDVTDRHDLKEKGLAVATQDFQDEFEYLDATQDNFSYKVQLDFEI